MRRIARVVGLLLAVAVVLSACGRTDALFKTGKLHLDQGLEAMIQSTKLVEAGDQAGATEALNRAQTEFQQAVDRFQELLAREPERVAALVNLGAAYYNLNQLDEAIASYERALEIEPADAGIHSNLAAAYFQQGLLDKALSEYQLAVDLDGSLAEAHFGLGVLYLQQGDSVRALEAFERFQSVDRGMDPMASSLAAQYLKQLKGQ